MTNVNFFPGNLKSMTREVMHMEVDAGEKAMAVPKKSPSA